MIIGVDPQELALDRRRRFAAASGTTWARSWGGDRQRAQMTSSSSSSPSESAPLDDEVVLPYRHPSYRPPQVPRRARGRRHASAEPGH
jgi:hypothetical protein